MDTSEIKQGTTKNKFYTDSIILLIISSILCLSAAVLLIGKNTKEEKQTPNFIQYGIASYYANMFEGRKTASGEIFSQDSMTAAHLHLPLGTIATVIHAETKREIQVKINDRGPYVEGRIIDLSARARDELGFEKAEGLADVIVTATLTEDELAALEKNGLKDELSVDE